MANSFHRPRSPFGIHPTLGIETFAPEFWRLIADRTTPAVPSESPAPATAPPPSLKPPLTHDGLRAQRDSLPGFADQLGDIPSPSPSPYPPFTGSSPPLTNQGLKRMRDATEGAWQLRDIPSPPPELFIQQPQADPEVAAWIAPKIKEVGRLRSTLERLESERKKPERSKDAAAFEEEMEKIRKSIETLESDIAKGALRLPHMRDNRV